MGKKILVVDDSGTDNEALCSMVRMGGFEAISAFSGEDGIEMAKKERPALIIMDVVMPGINGFQACKAITRDPDTQHIPVVICSNKHQDTDKAWGAKNGAKHYFVKPASPGELIAKINELIS